MTHSFAGFVNPSRTSNALLDTKVLETMQLADSLARERFSLRRVVTVTVAACSLLAGLVSCPSSGGLSAGSDGGLPRGAYNCVFPTNVVMTDPFTGTTYVYVIPLAVGTLQISAAGYGWKGSIYGEGAGTLTTTVGSTALRVRFSSGILQNRVLGEFRAGPLTDPIEGKTHPNEITLAELDGSGQLNGALTYCYGPR